MKLLLVFLLAATLVCSDAWVPYRPGAFGSCRNCFGIPVPHGRSYYDGCNYCTCNWFGPDSCTLMLCEYNRCFKGPWGRNFGGRGNN